MTVDLHAQAPRPDGTSAAGAELAAGGANLVGQYSVAIVQSPASIVITDRDGRIEYVNPKFTELTGYSLAEAIGKTPRILKSGATPAEEYARLWATITAGSTWRGEFSNRKKNGEIYWESASISPIVDSDGNITHFVAVKEDITEKKLAEEARRVSEERFRNVIENMQDFVIVTDGEGAITLVNPTTLTMLCYASQDELLGKNVADTVCVSPAEWQRVANKLAVAGKLTHEQVTFKRRDGSRVIVEGSFRLLAGQGGRPMRLECVGHDMTEHHRAEAALRASEELFRCVFEKAAIGKCLLGLDGRFLKVNAALCRLLGYSQPELLATTFAAITHPDDVERNQALRNSMLNADAGVRSFEKRYIAKDGHVVWVVVSVLLLRDSQGEPSFFITNFQDITERKRAETALRAREEQYRTLFEKSRDALMTLAPPLWQFTSGNPAAVALFGAQDGADLVSRGPWDYSPERQPDGRLSTEKAKEMIEIAMQKGSNFFTWTHRRLSGEDFPASVLLARMEIEGQPVLQATVRDETERLRYENDLRRARDDAEAATRSKSQFLANMSHEIRTPMNAVVGLTHLALKTELTPRQRSLLTKVQSSANGMVELISDILDFSKIEAGKLEMESIGFSLEEVLQKVSSTLATRALEKGLELHLQTEGNVPRTVVGDPLRLRQVLLNLTGNAVKFTEAGEVVISVELADSMKHGVRLRFSVRDTGPGIPLEQQARLFQPFVQADGSVTRRFGGSGLGLAISKHLVEKMGGILGVESRAGAGSTFSFTIPVGSPAPDQQDGGPAVPKDVRNLRVLVVDDSRTGREVLRALLTNMGFSVSTVASGEDALAELHAARVPFDLVLLDWYMPGMDGPQVVRQIRSGAGLARIPRIVMVTALDAQDGVAQGQAVGVDGFLNKPVSESALLDAIMDAMGRCLARAASLAPGSVDGPACEIAGRRVLIVEDNAINQEVAQGILEDFGLRVVVAADGRQALDILRNDAAFDAILMDVQMPVMDGYAAARAIRSQPATGEIPIIALTAHAIASERDRCLQAGMNEHVTKPIEPSHLRSVLQRIFGEKPARPRAAAEVVPAVARAPGAADLPSLPDALAGLDIKSGLRRLMGNRELYLRLLAAFAEQHHEDAEQIRWAVARGEVGKALATTHKLKGVAGNLSATQVFADAVRVERMLREAGPATPDAQLDLLAASLKVVAESIATLATCGPCGP